MTNAIAATAIPVTLFRQVLVWPVALDCRTDVTTTPADTAAAMLAKPSSPWTRVENRLRYLDAPKDAAITPETYEEFVYFHPFAQRFLYGDHEEYSADPAGDRPPLRLFRRDDLKSLEVTVYSGARGAEVAFQFTIDRALLYVAETGHVLLVLEIVHDAAEDSSTPPSMPMTLADAQSVLDFLRRTYPPFWFNVGTDAEPRLVPGKCASRVSITIEREGREETIAGAMPAPQTCWTHVAAYQQPPITGYWQKLIAPLIMIGDGSVPTSEVAVRVRPVVDERMPVLATLAVDDPYVISRGDWVRLCFADEAGTATLPYAESFLQDFEAKHCYDRFWQPGSDWLTTRYLVSGYTFVVVGKDDWFFRNVLQKHARRHYCQLFLIAHFYKAALLSLSERLSRAISRVQHNAGEAARDRVEDRDRFTRNIQSVQRDVLRFTHRFWFEDLSNHEQAHEVFALLRQHLGTDRLYQQVTREAAESSRFLDAEQQIGFGKDASVYAKVGAMGLAVALATGFLGMNLVLPAAEDIGLLAELAWFTITLTMAGAAIAGLAWLLRRR